MRAEVTLVFLNNVKFLNHKYSKLQATAKTLNENSTATIFSLLIEQFFMNLGSIKNEKVIPGKELHATGEMSET
jgi:hypothetical protein